VEHLQKRIYLNTKAIIKMIKLLLFEIVVVIITINVNLKRRMCFQWGNNKKGAINMKKNIIY